MKSINGITYTDENIYYNNNNTKSSHTGFDSVFEAEATIYATPESNGMQSNIPVNSSASQPVSSPEELNSYFQQASKEYGVDINLLKAVAKAESNFNASAVSSAGAIGVMQLMPSTAKSLGVDNPYNAQQNIMGGAKYLAKLLDKYNNNTSLALAAYNAGSGNVDKYGGIPPFKETINYVSKVLSYVSDQHDDNSIIYAASTKDEDASAATIYAVAATDASASARISLQERIPV